MSNVKVYIVNYLWHGNLTLTDCEVQGIKIGGAGHESCTRSCTPQAGGGGSKKRESQAASDPTNHVCGCRAGPSSLQAVRQLYGYLYNCIIVIFIIIHHMHAYVCNQNTLASADSLYGLCRHRKDVQRIVIAHIASMSHTRKGTCTYKWRRWVCLAFTLTGVDKVNTPIPIGTLILSCHTCSNYSDRQWQYNICGWVLYKKFGGVSQQLL